MVHISSNNNDIVKHIKKLMTLKRYRDKNNEFVIEGIRLCCDALKSNINIKSFLYTKKAQEKHPDIIKQLINQSSNSYLVEDTILSNLSSTKASQGVMCVCNKLDNQSNLDKINTEDKLVALENIQDPSNLGTILRSAEAFGINKIILTADCCDIYSPKVLRGSMGAIFRLFVFIVDDLKATLIELKNKGVTTYATVPSKAADSIIKESFSGPCVIVIGNEGNGLAKSTLSACFKQITIPMVGKAESLNAAAAANIIMWEFSRRGLS